MLQQTQVKTVLPFYDRFVERFPDVRALAEAGEEEVLRHWAGLGYYQRARNLHRAAKEIMTLHEGRFPSSREAIENLPGIGRYTAGAIRSIAFNQPDPIVDGNVRRVISRLRAVEKTASDKFFWEQAASWIPSRQAAVFNQAVMELGALVCVPGKPLCVECPVVSLCEGHQLGIQDRIPAARSMRDPEPVSLLLLVLEHGSALLLSADRAVNFVPGTWNLPTRVADPSLRNEAPGKTWSSLCRMRGTVLRECRPIRHSITHRRIEARVFYGRIPGVRPPHPPAGMKWVDRAELETYLTSSLFHKALQSAAEFNAPSDR